MLAAVSSGAFYTPYTHYAVAPIPSPHTPPKRPCLPQFHREHLLLVSAGESAFPDLCVCDWRFQWWDPDEIVRDIFPPAVLLSQRACITIHDLVQAGKTLVGASPDYKPNPRQDSHAHCSHGDTTAATDATCGDKPHATVKANGRKERRPQPTGTPALSGPPLSRLPTQLLSSVLDYVEAVGAMRCLGSCRSLWGLVCDGGAGATSLCEHFVFARPTRVRKARNCTVQPEKRQQASSVGFADVVASMMSNEVLPRKWGFESYKYATWCRRQGMRAATAGYGG